MTKIRVLLIVEREEYLVAFPDLAGRGLGLAAGGRMRDQDGSGMGNDQLITALRCAPGGTDHGGIER